MTFAYFLKKERVFTLLFLNALLVVIGYALAVATNLASVGPMKLLKTLIFFASLGLVFIERDWLISLRAIKNKTLIISLCLILPAFTLISINILDSIKRTAGFLIPFVYIWLSVSILIFRYGQKKVLWLFSYMIMVIYAIPMLSFILFGGDFSGETIYGKQEGLVFVSNHFGWSAALYIIATFRVTKKKRQPLVIRFFFVSLSLLAVYILIVSGSRSSILAVMIALMMQLFYYKGMPLYKKFLIVLAPVILLTYLISTRNDAMMFVIDRTERKIENKSEGRSRRLNIITERISERPVLWLTGVGLCNYAAFTKKGKGISNYHNSYFELLFGLGIPAFILFMVFMLYEPSMQFLKRVSSYDLLIIPLAIIPYFESNLTAGQFLFYPWFSYVFALNAKRPFAAFGKRNWFKFLNPPYFETNHPGPQNR